MNFVKLFTIFAAISVVQSATCKNNLKLINNDFVKEDDRKAILEYHNQIRTMVNLGNFHGQPKPNPPLGNLTWDYYLAAKAQEVADTCKFGTVIISSCDYKCVGQNIFAQTMSRNLSNKTIDWQIPIKSWANSVNAFVYPQTYTNLRTTGKYTQIVWSDTTHIGCGATNYQDANNKYVYFIVCNYGPCGNVRGKPPYKV